MQQHAKKVCHNIENETVVAYLRVLMGLTDRRKTSKNLVDSRKN